MKTKDGNIVGIRCCKSFADTHECGPHGTGPLCTKGDLCEQLFNHVTDLHGKAVLKHVQHEAPLRNTALFISKDSLVHQKHDKGFPS